MTLEEKYNEWLKRAAYQAQLLGIEIEFTTQSNGGWDAGDCPCVEVSGTDPDYGYYERFGSTWING